jgi:hypothetical protein
MPMMARDHGHLATWAFKSLTATITMGFNHAMKTKKTTTRFKLTTILQNLKFLVAKIACHASS